MLSSRNAAHSLWRKQLLPACRLRLQASSRFQQPACRNNPQHLKCNGKRYLSSDKKDSGEVSLEECARSLSQISSQQESEVAMKLAQSLSPEARREIVDVVSKVESASTVEAATQISEAEVPSPSYQELRIIALAQAIPFLGFGFMDNAILIVAGDAIDTSLGVVLGISTLCAAAIGNIISDVAGIALGTVIEDFCTNYLKLPMPNLTNAQRQLRSVRFANQFGCCVGIVVGCIIGMFPLFFIDSKKIQMMKRDAALQNLFQDVMSEAKQLVGAHSTSLFIIVENDPQKGGIPVPNPNGQYFYAKFFQSDSGEVSHRIHKIGKGIVSRAALTRQAWNIHDVDNEPDYSHEMTGESQRIRNMICVPVLDSEGRTIAVIRAFNKTDEGSVALQGSSGDKKPGDNLDIQRRGFTNNDVQVLKALASHISVSLQYLYQEKEEENAAVGVKDTIRILKEHGLAGITDEKPSAIKRRPPLFPNE